jgi:hypothetical protein
LLSEFLGEWATQTFIKYIFFAGNSTELQGYTKVDLHEFQTFRQQQAPPSLPGGDLGELSQML